MIFANLNLFKIKMSELLVLLKILERRFFKALNTWILFKIFERLKKFICIINLLFVFESVVVFIIRDMIYREI
jgi:hypothetical protein